MIDLMRVVDGSKPQLLGSRVLGEFSTLDTGYKTKCFFHLSLFNIFLVPLLTLGREVTQEGIPLMFNLNGIFLCL
jgi:hypothetical protein